MSKWRKRSHSLVMTLLIITSILSILSTWERQKINKQYKESVEKFGVVVDQYKDMAEQLQNKIDQ